MKCKNSKTTYFFVDEAGDPTFFDRYGRCVLEKEGCSPILLLGFICTENPREMRRKVVSVHHDVLRDPYLQNIPSFQKTKRAFHAKDDCPEVRERFYKCIKELDFKAEFVVARKRVDVFQGRHKGKENVFYDDLIVHLFKNKLHFSEKNVIYFAVRGNKTRQEPLEAAVQTAILSFENSWNTKVQTETRVEPQSPSDELCLQVADYMNWAVQRAFIRGEFRYFDFVREKVSFLVDLYDFEKYPNNFYNRKNGFSKNKMSPL